MPTEKEKNLEIGKRLLVQTKEKIEKMFLDCTNCTEDDYFSKPDKRCFTFSWKRNKMSQYLHVKVTVSLEKFSFRDPEIPDDGLRSLTIKLDITDRHGHGSGKAVFFRSTAFGISALVDEFGVLTMTRQWLNGFIGDQKKEESEK